MHWSTVVAIPDWEPTGTVGTEEKVEFLEAKGAISAAGKTELTIGEIHSASRGSRVNGDSMDSAGGSSEVEGKGLMRISGDMESDESEGDSSSAPPIFSFRTVAEIAPDREPRMGGEGRLTFVEDNRRAWDLITSRAHTHSI